MIIKQIINIKENSNKERLDIFLANKLNTSRNQIHKLIDLDLVLINDKKPKKAGQQIKTGNTIEILDATEIANQLKEQKNKDKKITDSVKNFFKKKIKIKIEIIAKEKDYLIINKQAGLLVHPTQADEANALSKILTNKFKEIKNVGDPINMNYGEAKDNNLPTNRQENPRPGIVHRLDKAASGLLVVARTQKMFEHLKNQFKKRTINKEYIVLVHGKIDTDHDIIEFPIARKKDGKMAALPKTEKGLQTDKGRDAKTEFWVEKHFINHTLIRVKLYTGRMHQIRAHFLAYNHPVVGDTLYYQKQYKRWSKKIDRLFLHCFKLGFNDLNDKYQEYEIEIPKELKDYLKTVK